jgi:YgiT-type zinc finger domain-containing protein
MKCVICKRGKTSSGTTTLTFVRPLRENSTDVTVVLKRVPAQVCSNCGEAYVDEWTSAEALRIAEQAVRAGIPVEISEFSQAAG